MLLDQEGSSHISINSNKSPSRRHPTSPTTNPTTHPSSPPDSHHHTLHWDQDGQTADLLSQLDDLESQQQRIEREFNRCIEHLLREIEKNKEINCRLAREVEVMRAELEEGGKDLLIIEEYMRRNLPCLTERGDVLQREQAAQSSGKNLLRSGSRSRNVLTRRTPGKLFARSKLTLKS